MDKLIRDSMLRSRKLLRQLAALFDSHDEDRVPVNEEPVELVSVQEANTGILVGIRSGTC